MKLFDCPKWIHDDDAALPEIAQAASAFVRFMTRQNEKRHLFTHGDIKVWHKRFFEKIVTPTYYAGNYRGPDSAKPCLDVEVHVGGVLGAPAVDVENLMRKFSAELERATTATDAFVANCNSPADRVRAAAQIAAFAGGSIIHIHPFVNGNGRMARMAMNFFLHRYLDRVPFYIDRPTHPNYSTASSFAMSNQNYIPLYQYLVEILTTLT